MNDTDHDLITILPEEAGERLDKVLARRFDAIRSRTYFQMLIEEQQVLLNGSPAKKRTQLKAGDDVQIHFIVTPAIGLASEPIPLDVIYEDEFLLVVNKPVGMVVHPAVGNWTGTFVNALLYRYQELYHTPDLRPGIVHRLDKDTSGLLLAAKTPLAQQRLIELFAQRKIHKEYLAICVGNPGIIEINAPIGRHPVHRKMMTVLPEGKPALSYCTTLAFDGKISLVRIVLASGRTHQIRVHLKHQGCPVLGDSVYGNVSINKKFSASRQLLHAHKLQFIHPMTQTHIELEVPLPQDMRAFTFILQGKYLDSNSR